MRRRSLSADDALGGIKHWQQNNQSFAQSLPQPSLPLNDPAALKRDAALKQSIAARIGDENLKRQARFEQSLADKMGGRQALIQPLPVLKQQPEQKIAQTVQPIPGVANPVNNFAGQKVGPQRASLQKLNPQISSQNLGQPTGFPLDDPLALKLDAAIKQSISDRTGDLSLRQQARMEQSLADKIGGRQVLLHRKSPQQEEQAGACADPQTYGATVSVPPEVSGEHDASQTDSGVANPGDAAQKESARATSLSTSGGILNAIGNLVSSLTDRVLGLGNDTLPVEQSTALPVKEIDAATPAKESGVDVGRAHDSSLAMLSAQ